jgi:hypothetical protein
LAITAKLTHLATGMTHPNKKFFDWKIALPQAFYVYFLYCHPINELSAVAVLVPKRAHLRLSPTTVWALTEVSDINPTKFYGKIALVELLRKN